MKHVILSAILIMSASLACAGQEGVGGSPKPPRAKPSAQQIYEALNIQPIAGSSFEVWYNEKSVGGLVCRQTRSGYPTAPATYACEMDPAQAQDNAAIYKALSVQAASLSHGKLGVGMYKKVVGALTCTLRHVVYPGAPMIYACTLQ